MKLHLPKMLLTAVLVACVSNTTAWGAYQALPDQIYEEGEIPTYTSSSSGMTHLVYNNEETDGKIITNANIDVVSNLWTGPGVTTATKSAVHTLVQFDGIISGDETWKLNEFASNVSGSVVYKFTNSSSTFTGTLSLESGSASATANSQISLYNVGEAFKATTVNFDASASTAKGILAIESDVTLGGITGGSDDDRITSTSADNTLTLNVVANAVKTYSGTYGTGSYFSSAYTEGENFQKQEVATSALNITKTGAGSQIFSGNGTLGSVTVSEGELALTGYATVGNVSISGGSLVIGKALTLNGTIAGNLTVEDLQNFTVSNAGITGGENLGNGFEGGFYQILTDNSTTKQGVTVAYNGSTYTTNESGAIDTKNYSTFLIKSGTEAVSTVDTANGDNVTNTIEMADGTTLTVDGDFDTVSTEAGATAATLTLAASGGDSEHTLTTLTATGANVLVNGAGTLNITSATATTLTAGESDTTTAVTVNLGANKHTVNSLVINDGATVTTTHDGDADNGDGFVKAVTINGGGTLKQTGDKLSAFGQGTGKMTSITIGGGEKEAKLLLTNRNAIHGTTVTMQGNASIGSTSGDGAVTDAKEDGTNKQYRDKRAILDFVGDNTVAVSGTNNTVDAALRLRGGTTTFNVANTTKDDVTTEGTLVLKGNIFRATVDGTATGTPTTGTFEKSGDGKLTIDSSSAQVHHAKVTGGTLEIAGGKVLTVGGDMTIGSGTLALSSENAFAVTGTMTFNEGARLSYTLSAALVDTDSNLSYTLGTAGSFSGVDNLTYTGSAPEGYTAQFNTVDNALMLDFILSEITLTETSVTEVVGFADGVLTLKTDTEKAMAYVFGEQLDVTISDDLWKSAIADIEADKFNISLQNTNGESIEFGTNQLTVVFNNQNGTVLSTTTAGTYSIPEPTTATLSLLALAALAARRRRASR